MSTAGENRPHVLPLRVYLGVGLALLILTALTVLVASKDLGEWNIVVALFIAGVKAVLVLLFFMHVLYDNKLFATVLSVGIGIFIVFIVLTMADTQRRGELNAETREPISPHASIYDSEGKPLPMGERDFTLAEGSTQKSGSGGGSEDIPFEMKHGYGPIKEVVEVGPLDTAMAKVGEKIFRSKCMTCHRLDERYTGPPLRGVTSYRSPTFIMNQILDPAQNVAKHPDMQAYVAEYYTIMTNQNVTREDARALVEFLRYETAKMTGGGGQ